MRTPEVERAMQHIGKGHVMGPEEYLFFSTARVLAAEVERLDVDAKAMTIMLRGRGELLARAEAAEARVAELLARPGPEETWRADAGWARVAELEAQNARLRAELEWWRDLRDESEGVAGYNLNGRLAYWGEFEDPTDEALAGTKEAK